MLFMFSVFLLEKFSDKIETRSVRVHLLQCAKALKTWYISLKHKPRVLSVGTHSSLCAQAKKVSKHYKKAGLILKPKFHFLVEMSKNGSVTGNPLHTSTYVDETLNGLLARLMKYSSNSTYALRILQRLEIKRIALQL